MFPEVRIMSEGGCTFGGGVSDVVGSVLAGSTCGAEDACACELGAKGVGSCDA